MNIFKGLIVCFSMYSVFPMPKLRWSKENMKHSLCFLPAVGLLIGLACYGAFRLLSWLAFSELFTSVILMLVPVILSGGIHLDGFIDTCDAVFSYGDTEKKLDILKDPRVGAFGVIGCIVYFLLLLAAYDQIIAEAQFAAIFPAVFMASRSIGVISLLTIPKAKSGGLGSEFSRSAQRRVVILSAALWLAAAIMLMFYINLCMSVLVLFMLVLCYAAYYRLAKKEFGGVTGDLTGFLIMWAELAMLMVIAVGGRFLC